MPATNSLPVGQCRLCGNRGPLTFEHVPPRSAGNDRDLRAYTLGATYRLAAGGEGERYTPEQRGSGVHALCETCNPLCSERGYVAELAKWINYILPGPLAGLDEQAIRASERGPVVATLAVQKVFPGRLVREIVVQLLAINEPLFGDDHPALRTFVLDETVRSLPKGVRLFLGLDSRPRALTVPVTMKLGAGNAALFTEVVHPPIRFGLEIDSAPLEGGDITWFAGYRPSSVAQMKLRLPVNRGLFPDDLEPTISPRRQLLEQHRTAIIRIARRHGASNVRLFGSVARGDDTDQSDIDLLVDLRPRRTLLALAGLKDDLAELLGMPVDVATAKLLRPGVRQQALREAVRV